MTIYFPTATVVLGASGYGPVIARIEEKVVIGMRETAGVAFTVTYQDAHGITNTENVPADSPFFIQANSLYNFSFAGNGATVVFTIYTPDEIVDPRLTAVSSSVFGGNLPITIAGQTLAKVTTAGTILDSSSNTSIVTFNNGGAAPCNGTARVLITANNAAVVTLTDGTTNKNTGITGDGVSWASFTFPVVAGVTYTLSATGLVLLGSKIYVGP